MKYRIPLLLSLFLTVGSALPAHAWIDNYCTVGFYKNHPQFLNSGSCTSLVFDENTIVSTVFPDVDVCVGSLTFLELLEAPSTICGSANTFAGAEVILLRQAIARMANAANSNPPVCAAISGTATKTNNTIDDAIATDNRSELISLEEIFNKINQGTCTLD